MKFLLFIISVLIKSLKPQKCQCQQSTAPNNLPQFEGLPSNILIDGKDYGKIIAIGKLIFLKTPLGQAEGLSVLKDNCPNGYRYPTLKEIQQIFDIWKNETLTYLNLTTSEFQLSPDTYYLINEKSFPDLDDGTNPDSWKWKSLLLNKENNTALITDVMTFKNNKVKTLCLQKPSIIISMYKNDFLKDIEYKAKIESLNLGKAVWNYGGKSDSGNEVTIKFSKTGCTYVEVWAKDIAGNDLNFCKAVLVVEPFGSDGDTTLTDSKIQVLDLVGMNGVFENAVFFDKGAAPIAPRINGGAYILYSNKDTKELNVVTIDKDMKLESNKTLGIKGYPLDIVETSKGIFIYANEPDNMNRGFIAGFSADMTKQFSRNVMNNGGPEPNSIKEQISFYDSKGELLNGFRVMFGPSNGKLSYGRSKVGLIFAHYNNFGGSVGSHSGDSQFTFDDDGNNELLGWSWKTSHSLVQSSLYDGYYHVYASLGDQYPKNIQICYVDPSKILDNVDKVRGGKFTQFTFCKQELMNDEGINGNGAGLACGRMGGITKIGETYAVTYARNPCTVKDYNGKVQLSYKNEMGIITWNINDKPEITNIKIIPFDIKGDNVISLRSAKYGANILIGYVTDSKQYLTEPVLDRYATGKEKNYYMLVDINGKIISNSFEYKKFTVPASDDLRVLQDGRVAWASIFYDGSLSFVYTEKPPYKINAITTPSIIQSDSLNSDKNYSVILNSSLILIFFIFSLLI